MRKFDQPKQCDDCLHRVGMIADVNSTHYGEAYCTVNKTSCFLAMEDQEECPDYVDLVPKPRENRYRPTNATLHGFVEGLK